MAGFFENLRGTMQTLFRFGKGGNQIKYGKSVGGDTDNTLEIRLPDDSAFAKLRGADPLDPQDFVTKAYHEANNNAADGNKTAVINVGVANVTTVGKVPLNARILRCRLVLDALYTAGTISIALTTGGTSLMAVADNALLASEQAAIGDIYENSLDVPVLTGGGDTITVTGTGLATGSCRVLVEYVEPTDITT